MTRAVSVALLLVAALVAPPAAALAQPAPTLTLELVDQTMYVPPDGSFHLSLLFGGAIPEGTDLWVEVYPQVQGTREAFDRAAAGNFETSTVRPGPLIYPIDGEQYRPDPTGRLELDVATVLTREDAEPGRVQLAVAGVYPVRLAVRDNEGDTLTELVTFVVRLPGDSVEGELSTAIVVPLDAPPSIAAQPDAIAPLDPDARAQWEAVIAMLEASPGVPLTLVPRPEAVAALRRGGDGPLADRLAAAVEGRQVLAPSLVDVDPTALVAAGLGDELTEQLDRGGDALATNLPGVRPDRRTWTVEAGLDGRTAKQLEALGVDQWIVPDALLDDLPPREATADPEAGEVDPAAMHTAEVVVDDSVTLSAAAVPDVELSAALTRGGAKSAVRRLELELAFLWFQAPADRRAERGVLLTTPPDWTPDAAFVADFLTHLAASPLLEPVTVDDYFGAVAPLTSADGVPVTRGLRPEPAVDLGSLAADMRQARSELATLSGYVISTAEPSMLEDALHVAVSSALNPEQRAPYFTRITERLDEVKRAVAPIDSETFTLTSRRAILTITLQNRLSQDVQVRVQLSASKLKIDKPDQVVVLPAGTPKAIEFEVEALATGAFPLSIQVRSPDRAILMRSSTWTVRSTAISGVGWMLSIGGLVFLAGWWVTHNRRVRREKREHAAEAGAAKARRIVGDTETTPDTLDAP
jgi:Family of unknown function (DUF6049)